MYPGFKEKIMKKHKSIPLTYIHVWQRGDISDFMENNFRAEIGFTRPTDQEVRATPSKIDSNTNQSNHSNNIQMT